MKFRIRGKLILVGFSVSMVSTIGEAQVTNRGLSTGANTNSVYQDASVARDSGLNQPLDLLNDFYPAIEVSVTDHENVRRRPGGNEDDLKMVVAPSLAYRSSVGRHQFYAAYSGRFTFHDEFDREDSDANDVSAKIGLDLTQRWDLDLFGSVGNSFERRGISGSRPFEVGPTGNLDEGPDRVNYRRYGADLMYGRKLGPLSATLGIERTDTGFSADDGGGLIQAGDRDRERDSIHLDVNYYIGEKTAVFGRIQKTEIDYDRATRSLDSEQTDYLIGMRWKPSSRLSGVVGIGRSDRDFDDSTQEGYDGNSYYANLNFMVNPFSNIQFAASRVVEESSDVDASFYESELIGVSWDHSITPQLVFNAYSKWIDDDYQNNREDKFQDWGIGLDYVWKQWLTAGIYYGEIERESTLDNVAYEDDYFGIRIRSDLRPLLKRRSRVDIEPSSFGPLRKSEPVQ